MNNINERKYKSFTVAMFKELKVNFNFTYYLDTNEQYIKSIHPYDNSEYHWAYSTDGYNWEIYRYSPGKLQVIKKTKNKKDVMRKLVELDKKENIQSNISHN